MYTVTKLSSVATRRENAIPGNSSVGFICILLYSQIFGKLLLVRNFCCPKICSRSEFSFHSSWKKHHFRRNKKAIAYIYILFSSLHAWPRSMITFRSPISWRTNSQSTCVEENWIIQVVRKAWTVTDYCYATLKQTQCVLILLRNFQYLVDQQLLISVDTTRALI